MQFKEFLSEVEFNVGVDPDKMSAADAVAAVKQQYKMGSNNPSRALRQRQNNLKDKRKEIQSSDDPLADERLAIQTLEQKIARMKMNLARKEEQLAAQQGVDDTVEPGV